jgi:S-adenosylmethionine hydrolase
MKSPIVLLTDFGLKDHYAGVLKGVILSIHPKATVIDLSHGIEPQNVAHGASLLEVAYSLFPKDSIFVCVVDPGVGTKRKILCAKTPRYYFLGPDNGILTLALQHEKNVEIRSVENRKYFRDGILSSTFHGRDIFSPVAANLSRRNIFSKLGPKISKIQPLRIAQIKKTTHEISGEILYFDHFGNALTNIHERDGNKAFWERAQVFINDINLGKLRSTYGAGPRKLCAVLNSSDQLEIAMPRGSAREEASLEVGDKVRVVL